LPSNLRVDFMVRHRHSPAHTCFRNLALIQRVVYGLTAGDKLWPIFSLTFFELLCTRHDPTLNVLLRGGAAPKVA